MDGPTDSSSSNKGEGKDITRSKGDFPPGTYAFKVESFSLLSEILKKTEAEKLESCVFESGGHKWKLVLYPYGDTKRNGKDHISLYLALVEENAIPDGFILHVSFKFFVHDQIRDDYMIIKDDTVKRYHASRNEHGFHQLLPLSIFKDSLNGYLVNDSCVFGVEVHVFNMPCKGEKIKLINNPPQGTFTWKFMNFSTLKQETVSSAVFVVAGHRWKVVLYPKGAMESEKGKYISLQLKNVTTEAPQNVYVEYKMMVKDQINGNHEEIRDKDWYSTHWIFKNFMTLTELHDPSRGFLVKDTLIVEVEITLISAVEAFRLL